MDDVIYSVFLYNPVRCNTSIRKLVWKPAFLLWPGLPISSCVGVREIENIQVHGSNFSYLRNWLDRLMVSRPHSGFPQVGVWWFACGNFPGICVYMFKALQIRTLQMLCCVWWDANLWAPLILQTAEVYLGYSPSQPAADTWKYIIVSSKSFVYDSQWLNGGGGQKNKKQKTNKSRNKSFWLLALQIL